MSKKIENQKFEVGQSVKFSLDNRWDGEGIIVDVNKLWNNLEVKLTKRCEEFPVDKVILVFNSEVNQILPAKGQKMVSPKLDSIIGKTIAKVETDSVNCWTLIFTDGSKKHIWAEGGGLGLGYLSATDTI